MNLSIILLTALLGPGLSEAASLKDARKALENISEATLSADIASATKEQLSQPAEAKKDFEYVICPSKEVQECHRYVVFRVGKKEELEYQFQSWVLDYRAYLENGAVKLDQPEADYRDHMSLSIGNFNTVKLALAQLEREYTGGEPVKGKAATHPFSIDVVQLAASGERMDMNKDSDHWETSTNTLVFFSESFDSRVVYWQGGYSYVVRTVDNGEKIVKTDVRRVKLDSLLKR